MSEPLTSACAATGLQDHLEKVHIRVHARKCIEDHLAGCDTCSGILAKPSGTMSSEQMAAAMQPCLLYSLRGGLWGAFQDALLEELRRKTEA